VAETWAVGGCWELLAERGVSKNLQGRSGVAKAREAKMNTLKLCARDGGASLQSITCKVAKRWDGNAAKHLFVKGCERLPIPGNQIEAV
jgi:hypothetical protein